MPTSRGPHVSFSRILAWIALSFLSTGCTSTTVTFHSIGMHPPLCEVYAKVVKTNVYWGAAWRTDQKEIARREVIIAKGIEDFFQSNPCFSVQTISRTIDGRNVLVLSDRDILASAPTDIDRVHILRFEELGPVLQFYISPILWTSDLDIQIRVRTLNARTASLESDVTARWRKGGPFNLRGTAGLPEDLANLLHVVFSGTTAL
jgi:hypothetical protein